MSFFKSRAMSVGQEAHRPAFATCTPGLPCLLFNQHCRRWLPLPRLYLPEIHFAAPQARKRHHRDLAIRSSRRKKYTAYGGMPKTKRQKRSPKEQTESTGTAHLPPSEIWYLPRPAGHLWSSQTQMPGKIFKNAITTVISWAAMALV